MSEKELETQPQIQLTEQKEEYIPRGSNVGWFNRSLEEWYQTIDKKFGIVEYKNSMEHYYSKRDYEKVVELSQVLLVESKLTNNNRELIELIMRTHLNLQNYETAYQLLDCWKTNNEPGQNLFKGRVLSLNFKLTDALLCFQKYLNNRVDDYVAFKYIGLAIDYYYHNELRTYPQIQALESLTNVEDDTEKINIATKVYTKSLNLYKHYNWKLEINYIKTRYEKELGELTTLVNRSKGLAYPENLDIPEELATWLTTLLEK